MHTHRCRVQLRGARGCQHQMCYPIPRAVPSEWRCDTQEPSGYGDSGGAPACGCAVPTDVEAQILRQLRDDLLECRRRGFVMVLSP